MHHSILPGCLCAYQNMMPVVHVAPQDWQLQRARAFVPAGWRLVPEIPTEAMRQAGAEAVDDQIRWSDAAECYVAMLDAAPKPDAGK